MQTAPPTTLSTPPPVAPPPQGAEWTPGPFVFALLTLAAGIVGIAAFERLLKLWAPCPVCAKRVDRNVTPCPHCKAPLIWGPPT